MSWQEIDDALGTIRLLCEPVPLLTVEIHASAVKIARRYGYNIYDALILAAALDLGCDTLYSEDMQDGQNIDALTILNPFFSN